LIAADVHGFTNRALRLKFPLQLVISVAESRVASLPYRRLAGARSTRLPIPPSKADKEAPEMATKPAGDSPTKSAASAQAAAAPQAAAGARVRWKTDNVKSSYANFCNASSTREEVVLNFGVSHDWERQPQDMEIELSHRIVLSPFAAKRLAQLLTKLVGEYESRYGELKQ